MTQPLLLRFETSTADAERLGTVREAATLALIIAVLVVVESST